MKSPNLCPNKTQITFESEEKHKNCLKGFVVSRKMCNFAEFYKKVKMRQRACKVP